MAWDVLSRDVLSYIPYECVDTKCENLTNCLQGVNSLTNTIV